MFRTPIATDTVSVYSELLAALLGHHQLKGAVCDHACRLRRPGGQFGRVPRQLVRLL